MGVRGTWIAIAIGTVGLGIVPPSHALTTPMPGAVALPGDFTISLPFPEGAPVRATCAYGPGCSGYHVNTDTVGYTNDYYALDLIRDQAGNGAGEPVTAIASGTVLFANWATGGFSSFGRYIAIEHDYAGDGHTYMSIYAHLQAISVSVGEHVESKQEIGLLGGSSNMLDDQFGAHVHIALYQDAILGPDGAHSGHAVVPEPIDGYEDLVDGTVMVAGAGTPPPDPSGDGSSGGAGDGATSWGPGETTGDSWGGSASAGTSGGDAFATSSDPGGSDGATTPGFDSEALPPGGGSAADDGCACTTTPARRRAPGAWLLLLTAAWRRRRRRRAA